MAGDNIPYGDGYPKQPKLSPFAMKTLGKTSETSASSKANVPNNINVSGSTDTDPLYRMPEDNNKVGSFPSLSFSEESTPKEPVKPEGKYPVTPDGSLTEEEVIQYLKASPLVCKMATMLGAESIEDALETVTNSKNGTIRITNFDKIRARDLLDIVTSRLKTWKDDAEFTHDPPGGFSSVGKVRRVTVDGQKLYLDKEGNYYNFMMHKVKIEN